MSSARATHTDVPLDQTGTVRARISVMPAVVEASNKDQNFEQYGAYETASVVVNTPDPQGVQMPVASVHVTTVYEVYFQCEDGRRLRRAFSFNPGFIPGYRALLAEVGLEGGTAKQTLAIRNVETERIFRWPAVAEAGVSVFKSIKWPRRVRAAMWISGFFALFFPEFVGPVFIAVAVVAFRNRKARQYNRRINEDLQKAAEELFQRAG